MPLVSGMALALHTLSYFIFLTGPEEKERRMASWRLQGTARAERIADIRNHRPLAQDHVRPLCSTLYSNAVRLLMRYLHTTSFVVITHVSFFVCLPGIAVTSLWTYKAEMAHAEHTEHIK